jgi:hypothetical protein
MGLRAKAYMYLDPQSKPGQNLPIENLVWRLGSRYVLLSTDHFSIDITTSRESNIFLVDTVPQHEI